MSKEIKITLSEPWCQPVYGTTKSAGADLCSTIDVSIMPGERKLIPTGVFIELPEGYEAQIRPRSGMALKYGITVLNSPGTIDADYRGEIGAILHNTSDKPYHVRIQDRVCQMVIAKYEQATWKEGELEITERGFGGFGHTGK